MVRPQMEYAAAVWDPHHVGNIQKLEKVQRRAARWAPNDYGQYSSVTSMLEHLGWDTLQRRRTITKLQTLFKILHNEYSLEIPCISPSSPNKTHQTVSPITLHHPKFNHPSKSTGLLLKKWNHLPTEIIEQENLNLFSEKLSYYYRTN